MPTQPSIRAFNRPANLVSELVEPLHRDGFVHVAADRFGYLLEQDPVEVRELLQSWNRLEPDNYLLGPKFRSRLYAMYRGEAATGYLDRKPHGPHFQRNVHNAVFGGLERWFQPMERGTVGNLALREMIGVALSVFAEIDPPKVAFHVETHQFRVEPVAHGAGHPTPEGLHRDGRDWVAIFMIARENVQGGETRICDVATDRELARFTLKNTFDAVFINDHAVKHVTTAIRRARAAPSIAYRDVLVVTFIDEVSANSEVSKH